MQYAQFGDIKFEALFGFDAFEKKTSSVLAENRRIGGKPRLQKTSLEADKITLNVRLHYAFCTPEEKLKQFDDYVNNAPIHPFILGNGSVVGSFVLKEAVTTWKQTDGNSNIVSANVKISLVEYYAGLTEDIQADNKKDAGFARPNNTPLTIEPITLTPDTIELDSPALDIEPSSDAYNAGLAVSKSSAISNGVQADIANLSVNLDKAKGKLQKVLRANDELISVLNNLNTFIDADTDSELYDETRSLAGRIPTTTASITTLSGKCNDMITAIDSGNGTAVLSDLNDVLSSASTVKSDVDSIKKDSSGIVKLTATGN